MRGVQILCVAVWPCAAAIGMLVAAREPSGSRAPLHVWGPAVLMSASSAVIAVAFEVVSPGPGDGMVHAFQISGVIGGAAVAWMLITWLRLPGYQRVSEWHRGGTGVCGDRRDARLVFVSPGGTDTGGGRRLPALTEAGTGQSATTMSGVPTECPDSHRALQRRGHGDCCQSGPLPARPPSASCEQATRSVWMYSSTPRMFRGWGSE